MKMKKILSFFLAGVMIVSIMPRALADVGESNIGDTVNEGLIAYYNFETESERPGIIADQSGYGNDAAVLNNVREGNGWWDPGVNNVLTVKGGVAIFPGNTSTWGGSDLGAALRLPAAFNTGVKDFTFSAWIKANPDYEYNNRLTRIFDFGNLGSGSNNAYNSIFLRYTPSSGQIRFQDREINKYVEKNIDTMPFTDAWVLLTVTMEYDGEKYYKTKVYINGKEEPNLYTEDVFTRSLDDLGELTDESNGLFIGRTVWGATNQNVTDNPDFCGQMDEIRIYNRAVSRAEVEYIYNTTSPVGKIEMESYQEPTAVTQAGDYPILPETVFVTYTTGATEEEAVEWENLSGDIYAHEGEVIIKGITQNGNEVTCKLIVSAKESGVLTDGLVLYYNFDTESEKPETILDASGNGRDAAVYNTVQEVNAFNQTVTIDNSLKVADKVAYFPGHKLGSDFGLNNRNGGRNSYSGAAFKLPEGVNEGIGDFTYSAWIYVDTTYRYNSGMQRFFDFGKADSSNTNSVFFRYIASSGDARFQDREIASWAEDNASFVSSSLSDKPFNDKWAMLTVTYSMGANGYYEPKVYINGQEDAGFNENLLNTRLTRSLGDLGQLSSSDNGLWIGRTQWNNADNPDFCGKMDEIRLYNRALTAGEVAELYMMKKPSDMPVDWDNMPKTEIGVADDVTVSGKYPDDRTLWWNWDIMPSSKESYDAYDRFVLIRFRPTEEEISRGKRSAKTVIRTYCNEVYGKGKYNIYALVGDCNNWDENVTYNAFTEQTGLALPQNGQLEGAQLVGSMEIDNSVSGGYIEWDVTSFMQTNSESEFSFLIAAEYGGVKMKSGETDDAPKMIIYQQGIPISVKRLTDSGEVISETAAYAVEGQGYSYTVSDKLTSFEGDIYVYQPHLSQVTISSVDENSEIIIVYKKAEAVAADTVDTITYVGKAPELPKVINITAEGESARFGITWDNIDESLYAQKGEFVVKGYIVNTSMTTEAKVTVFPNVNNAPGCDLVIYSFVDGQPDRTIEVKKAYGTVFVLDESYATANNMYVLERIEGDVNAIGESLVLDKLGLHIELYYVMKETLDAEFEADIKADNLEATSYTLTVKAKVLNTEKKDVTVLIGMADYNDNGEMTSCVTEKAEVQSRTGEFVEIEKKIPYTDNLKNMKLYLWDTDMRPLTDVINVCDVKIKPYFDDDVIRMMPTYEGAVSSVRKANDYWQSNYSPSTWTNGIHPAFWARAAYHTGNIEAYKLLGDEDYLNHSVEWANYNNWMGNDNTSAAKDEWTWGYDQNQGSKAVLFGDWQICFQSYIDMYAMGVEGSNIDRVLDVIDYQITKENDDFWWWADSLYMVMPVFAKLYKLTEDTKYLDALYKYFKFAMELMYDGPEGIPTDADGYTTSAYAHKNSRSEYSNPEDYKYLFYRDGGYVFPLNAIQGRENEKNFWARGDGWVFAGLAKVLEDMPETYEHYDAFKRVYLDMAGAIIACQKVDDKGRGFWTQSMLLDYPKGTNGNDEGYETSGTAFFTYGLFWGINHGLLSEDVYLEPAVRAYGYLNEVALLDDGKVGYVQPIGSNATQATPQSTTQDFGVGAFLLAECEAARYAQKQ